MSLEISREGAVTVLTLNRPEVRNALSAELIMSLRAAVADAGADPDVRVIVLTGADPAFSAGLDLKELGSSGRNLGLANDGPWTPIDKPLIAAVNGVAVTGGLEVALACDIRIASDRAMFADTHARVGVMPGWGLTVRLPAVVGQARALEMSLGGTRVDAATALGWGLVNRVVPHDELMPTALDLARRIAEPDPTAATKLLGMYRDQAELPPAAALTQENRTCREWNAAIDRSLVPTPAALNARR
jgi:enoyl-CoA hydratase